MAEDEDDESKTEEATDKKVQDTLEKGKSPISHDAGVVALFAGFLFSLSFLVESFGPRMATALGLMLSATGAVRLRNGADAVHLLQATLMESGHFLAPVLGLFMAAGLAASFAQGQPRIAFERIQPDLSRISIRGGWKRIFGVTGLVELLKATVKISIVGGAIFFSTTVDRSILLDAIRTDPSLLPGLAIKLLIHVTAVICIAVALLTVADIVWVRLKWRRDMRMSRHELKDELKQTEGDPLVKARLRSLAQDRARKRMMAAVPKATLVVTNPTHYAIALRYVREEGGAPLVLAKGKDLIALKIKEVAEQHSVPVFEKKALVRAMFDRVEVDNMIPQDFYRPIAELIHFLYTTHGRYASPNL